MSAHASPSPVSISMAWTSTLPPVVPGKSLRRDRDARRQAMAQRQTIGEASKGVQPDVGHDSLAGPFHHRRAIAELGHGLGLLMLQGKL